MVEGLTLDRGVAGSSLTGGGCVVSLSKTFFPLLSTGSTKEDLSRHDFINFDWDVKNQINNKKCGPIL